jgi:hypothetical protein
MILTDAFFQVSYEWRRARIDPLCVHMFHHLLGLVSVDNPIVQALEYLLLPPFSSILEQTIRP